MIAFEVEPDITWKYKVTIHPYGSYDYVSIASSNHKDRAIIEMEEFIAEAQAALAKLKDMD
jgi:hypothetical protein